IPEPVDFGLVLTVHLHRHCLVKGELRSPIQRSERLAVQFELYGQDLPFRSGAALAIVRHVENIRVLEQLDVELRRFFGFTVKPETRCDLLHDELLPEYW